MPAPTQVPPFLASVLGGQVDDVTTQGYLVNPEARSSTIGADSRQRSEQEIYNDGDLDLITASRSQPILLAPAVSSATSFDLASTLPSPLPTLLVPPLNFDMVCASRTSNGGTLYRSGFPNERNYPFLNTLQLRTVVYLSSDDVRPNLQQWIDSSRGRTRLLHFRLSVNKEPFAESMCARNRSVFYIFWLTVVSLLSTVDVHVVADALRAILDRRNLPMLMHCNKGERHRS